MGGLILAFPPRIFIKLRIIPELQCLVLVRLHGSTNVTGVIL